MSEMNYYRVTVLYQGEGKPYHNTSGGNIVIRATSEDDARSKTESFFKDLLKQQGFGGVDFILKISSVSEDEVKYLLENRPKAKDMVN